MFPRSWSLLAVCLVAAPADVSAFASLTANRRQSDRRTAAGLTYSAAYSSSASHLAAQQEGKRFDSLEDYEQARTQFESLWTKQTRRQVVDPVQMRKYHDLLRQRHQQEIRLLKSLEHSDNAVKDLIELWSTHVAPPVGYAKSSFDPTELPTATSAPNTLVRLQPSALQPSSDPTAHADDNDEEALLRLAQEHPTWAEPCLRLAAFYWRNNQALPAYEWALKGLENQPYHFVSSTMFMLLSIQQGHQAEVEYWSNMRLPKTFGAKRSQWVQRAVYECQDRFDQQSSEIQQILADLNEVAAPKRSLESYVTVSAEMPSQERQQYGTGIHTNSGWAFSQPPQDDAHTLAPGGPSATASFHSTMHPSSPGLTPFSGTFTPRPTTSTSGPSSSSIPSGGFLGGLAEPWHAPNSMRSESTGGHSHFGGPSSAMPMRGDEGFVPPPLSPPHQQQHHHHQQPATPPSSPASSSASASYWELEGLDDSSLDAWQ